MSTVKVFVPTYRRHQLLPRALRSLREQTFRDWCCEVHNDAPDDEFPRQLVAQLNDPRIKLVNHAQRLGGAGTMNAFYEKSRLFPFWRMTTGGSRIFFLK